MAFTADTRTRLETRARRIGKAASLVAARAASGGRRMWVHKDRTEERTHLRWGAAALLVLVGVISALVVPHGPDAVAAPTFDSASVAASADPPAASPLPTANGPVAAPVVQPVNTPLPLKPTVPVGKGMWIHRFERAYGGNPDLIVNHALSHGLTHIYLRLGSSRMGFYGKGDLERLLPVAHQAGLKVVGWDYPYLLDAVADGDRAGEEINYVTASGDRIDAFAADIETASEGTNLTVDAVRLYNVRTRQRAGDLFPLIAAVPRPSPSRWFPYAEATQLFDAVAPMVYWVNRDPATDVARAIADLRPLNKPILPVGQSYDPGIDGSHSWGPPSAGDINKFMQTAGDLGVPSYSFWSWDTANPEQWSAISSASLIDLKPLAPGPDLGTRVTALQRVLRGLGRPVALDGSLGAPTIAALEDLQRQLGVPVTGQLDFATLQALKAPRR